MSKKVKEKRHKRFEYVEEDWDDVYYFIAGYTDGGAPYGVTWEEIVSQELKFRPAVKKDANIAAELIQLAIGDIAEQLTGQTKSENIRKTLACFFQEEDNRLSYQNTIVADILGKVIGLVIIYSGEEAARLDEPILKRLRRKRRNEGIFFDKEADIGDFYIDTVCVLERTQGYGIGSALLREAEKAAAKKGFSRLALNAAHGNPSAKKLYEHLGYKEEKVIEINSHPYDYMVKIVEGESDITPVHM